MTVAGIVVAVLLAAIGGVAGWRLRNQQRQQSDRDLVRELILRLRAKGVLFELNEHPNLIRPSVIDIRSKVIETAATLKTASASDLKTFDEMKRACEDFLNSTTGLGEQDMTEEDIANYVGQLNRFRGSVREPIEELMRMYRIDRQIAPTIVEHEGIVFFPDRGVPLPVTPPPANLRSQVDEQADSRDHEPGG